MDGKTPGAVWPHIDFFQVSLACFFYLSAFDHIKTTRISMLHRWHLVNLRYLVAPADGEHTSAAGKRSHRRQWVGISPWPHAY